MGDLVEVKNVDFIEIPKDAIVKRKICGNVVEVFWQRLHSGNTHNHKINKDMYFDDRTGEVFEYEHGSGRSDCLYTLFKAFKQGRDIINSNCTDASRIRFLTLTYRENMMDTKKLYCDFDNFNRRLRSKIGRYEYITAVEPQGRGAWHLHVILIFESVPFLPVEFLQAAWGHGFIKIERVDGVDNVGAYLTAYLTDIDGKKYARLGMYPSGFHPFRWSRGICKPVVETVSYEQVLKDYKDVAPTYKKSLFLSDKDSDISNQLSYIYYNTNRLNCQ